jgi:dephospho-CoA kinase
VKRVGLTGGIGSGKTTIARILEAIGYPVFYSDQQAKSLMTNPEVQQQINSILEQNVFPDGELDRAVMADLIFKNIEKREAVNAYLHPKVREAFQDWANQQNSSLVFNEAAILFETGAYKLMDVNVLVLAPQQLRISRTMKRDQVSEGAVLERISKQADDETKIPLADFIIYNDDVQPVLRQVENLIVKLSIISF